MSKILIVEDEVDIADLEKDYLELSGFEVEIENDGDAGLKRALEEDFDMFILDLMLPDMDGFDICKEIRREKNVPILMVSAKKDDIDKIRGLGLGADDYIEKPFEPLELMARVKAQLRRYTRYNDASNREEQNILEIAGLTLNKNTHQCMYGDVEITLTPIEFNILWILISKKGKVISSENLFEQVWKEKYFKNNNNTVMVHIRHLREKLGAVMGHRELIKTVWGVGYKIEE